MKKSKLSVGLVASFIGALAMSACNQSSSAVQEEKGTLVKLVDYNGEQVVIKTDDMYKDYTNSSDGTKLYYDAVLEALIRYEYPKLNEEGLRSYDSLLAEAEDKYTSARETASDNADNNGTSFDEEWEKILESNGCKDEDDPNEALKKHYLYDLEKEELSDWYAKKNVEPLKDQYIGVDKYWDLVSEDDKVENVNSLFPYHIIHVLVSLSASKDDYHRGTITQGEAENLWKVVRQLIDKNYSFGDVAFNLSDDTGSKSQYGDVGIMSTKTSFYNEFKLGIYAYDAVLSGVNAENATNDKIYEAFGLDSDAEVTVKTTSTGITKQKINDATTGLIQSEMVTRVKTPVSNGAAFTTIPTVPYDVFRKISEYAKEDKIDGVAPESGDVALPRNVLYNQFLNFHSPFVITAEDIVDNGVFDSDVVAVNPHDFSTSADLKIPNNNFVEMTINGENKKVLCDADGDVVIGVRSEAGIHFMVMRKSIFKASNEAADARKDASVEANKANVSLQDYYSTEMPGTDNYPVQTYVNIKKTDDQSFYKTRIDTIKSELKSSNFDAAYDYRLYEYLMSNDLVKGKISFSNQEVEENINEYIKLLRETKVVGDEKSMNDAWQSYLLMLKYQNDVRSFKHSLVPTTCAFRFNAVNEEQFKEGGKCYVKK